MQWVRIYSKNIELNPMKWDCWYHELLWPCWRPCILLCRSPHFNSLRPSRRGHGHGFLGNHPLYTHLVLFHAVACQCDSRFSATYGGGPAEPRNRGHSIVSWSASHRGVRIRHQRNPQCRSIGLLYLKSSWICFVRNDGYFNLPYMM